MLRFLVRDSFKIAYALRIPFLQKACSFGIYLDLEILTYRKYATVSRSAIASKKEKIVYLCKQKTLRYETT